MNQSKPKLSPEKAAELAKLMADNGLMDEMKMVEKRLPESAKQHFSSVTEGFLKSFITQDPVMIGTMKSIRILAGTEIDDPVLITGPSGTGKEILANALHGGREGKFVSINCAGMPENLIESELFGHVKGAFTGATVDKKGLLEEAVDGTFFMDEIGELSMSLQAKLLRTLQTNEIRKVGALTSQRISCRFVSATHNDLEVNVRNKTFRLDLFYRLSTFHVKTSALAERPDDVPLIIKSLDPEGKLNAYIDQIKQLPLHGNVRELQQIVKRFNVLNILPI